MQLNVVIIDDSPLQLSLTAQMVKKHPKLKLVGTFTSAHNALKFVNSTNVHMAIVDVEMPFVSGFEFISLFNKQTVTIMISTLEKFALESFNHGCNYFLLKPLNEDKFFRAVRKAVGIIAR